MIILYDHMGFYPDLIWDDGAETVMAFRINTGENQSARPFEIFCANYDQIQYIEALTNPAVAKTWVDENITDETQKELAHKLIQNAIGKRSYTGTTSMKNVYNKDSQL